MENHRPISNSKMVLSIVKSGPPNWGELRSSSDILPTSRSIPNAMPVCSAPTQLECSDMSLQAIY